MAPPRRITGRPRRWEQMDALAGALVQRLGVVQPAEVTGMAWSTAYELLRLPKVQDQLRQARADALATASSTAAARG